MSVEALPPESKIVAGADLVKDVKSGDWGIPEREDGLVRVRTLRGTDFDAAARGHVGDAPLRYLTPRRLEGRELLPGDLLIEMSGGSAKQSTGRALLVTESLLDASPEPIGFTNFVKRVRVKPDVVDPDFFYFQWLDHYRRGSTRTHERRTTGIRNFKLDAFLDSEQFLVPPFPEQRAIALVLRAVQQAREATEQVIDAASELKRSLLRHLFTHGPVPVALTNSVQHQENPEIGPIPETWAVSKLHEVADVRYGLGQPPTPDLNGVPMIRATNIKRGRIVADDLMRIASSAIPDTRDPFLVAGDVLVVRSGAYTGDVALVTPEWEGSIAGYDLVVSPSKSLNSAFCAAWLLSPRAQSYFRGQRDRSAQPHINKGQLENTWIPLPPTEEQDQIATVLALAEKKIVAEEQRSDALRSVFSSLLSELMSGRIRVPELMWSLAE